MAQSPSSGESPIGHWLGLVKKDEAGAILSALGWSPESVIQTAKLLATDPDNVTSVEDAANILDERAFPLALRTIAFQGTR